MLLIGISLFVTACQPSVQQITADIQPGEAPALSGDPTAFKPEAPTATGTVVPTATLTPIPCETIAGQVVEVQFEVEGLAEQVVFRVYEPPCYGSSDHAPFPVLYMLHGQTYTDDQWQRIGIAETADQLIADGLMPPYLIVLPLEHDTFADIYASEFRLAFLEVLIPWVDSNYDTCVERECRAIGGLSRGGAWAVHLGFSNWWMFGAIGAHSTPPFNGDLYRLQGWVNEITRDQLPRVYMDVGRSDIFRPYAADLDTALTSLQVPHEWVIPEGDHSEGYWGANLKGYLVWYGSGW
jgi:enterochelin esterase-like enzyme